MQSELQNRKMDNMVHRNMQNLSIKYYILPNIIKLS